MRRFDEYFSAVMLPLRGTLRNQRNRSNSEPGLRKGPVQKLDIVERPPMALPQDSQHRKRHGPKPTHDSHSGPSASAA